VKENSKGKEQGKRRKKERKVEKGKSGELKRVGRKPMNKR
jgi:hypothetical protein